MLVNIVIFWGRWLVNVVAACDGCKYLTRGAVCHHTIGLLQPLATAVFCNRRQISRDRPEDRPVNSYWPGLLVSWCRETRVDIVLDPS